MNNPYSRYDLRINNIPLVKTLSASNSFVPITHASNRSEDDTRVTELERRLTVSELSQGNLLKEVIRLRQDLASQLGRKDRQLTSEAAAARQLAETGLRSNNESLGQLASQVQRLNDKQRSEEGTIASLVNLVRATENAMLSNQQDVQRKVDLCTSRTNELRDVLNELRSVSTVDQQHNRLAEQNLIQNFKSLQSNVERSLEKQRDSLGAIEVRNQELEHKMEKDNIRILAEITETTDKLARKVLQKEMRQNEEWQAKVTQLEKNIHTVQEELDTKWSSMGQKTTNALNQLVDGRKKTKKNLKRLDDAITLLDRRLDEQKRVQDKLIAAEIESRRLKEVETASKLTQMETVLGQSKENLRQTIERTTKIWNEKMDASMTNVEEILPKVLRTVGKLEQDVKSCNNTTKKHEASLSSLNTSTSKLTADVTELKQSSGKLEESISSFIQSTRKLEKETKIMKQSNGKIEEDISSLKLSTKKLEKDTQSIQISSGVITSLNLSTVKMEKDIIELQHLKVELEKTITEVLNPGIKKLKEQMSQSMASTSKLQNDVNRLSKDVGQHKVHAVDDKLIKSLSDELDRRLKEEAKNRETDINEMKKRIKKLPDELKRTLPEDVVELQEGIRKVAETIQIVKTITGMKIQAEQHNRIQQCQDLEENVNALRTEVHRMRGAEPEEDDD